MNIETVAHYTGLSVNDIKRFSKMAVIDIYKDNTFIAALQNLNRAYLEETLPLARSAYEKHIDAFKQDVQSRYGLTKAPMSAFTLGNWVVGVLQYPASAHELIKKHNGIKGEVIAGSLQDILDILDEMPEGSAEWKQALCLLSFPLMNK